MYRRTLAAYWSAQPGELKADECIEDIFAGGDGWGDREKPYLQQHRSQGMRFTAGDSSGSLSDSEPRHMRGSQLRKSHETLRPGDMIQTSSGVSQMKAEAARQRQGLNYEVDELDVREDLRSWRCPI